jgi:phosphate/sulfate permease
MKRADGEDAYRSRLRRGELLLRGAVPLILVALALLAGPTLLVWWLSGEPLSWRLALIGGAISLALLAAMALAFGWAVGRMGRWRRE